MFHCRSKSLVFGVLFLVGHVVSTPLAPAQCLDPTDDKVFTAGGAAFDGFGRSVGIGNGLVLVGANAKTQVGVGSGVAYCYQKTGTGWLEVQTITSSDLAAGDSFGWNMGVDGTTAVIAAIGDDDKGAGSGSVYVFDWNGSQWIETQKLTAPGGDAGDQFGYSVDIKNDLIVVGAINDSDKGQWSGSVYVFRDSGAGWVFEQKLVPSDGAAIDQFGFGVATDGTVVVGGAVNDDDLGSDSGSAYIYRHNGTSWALDQKILAGNGASSDWFGWTCEAENGRVLVGAVNGDSPTINNVGTAYVFEYNGSAWSESQMLSASDARGGDSFGWSLALDGPRLVVGAVGAMGLGVPSGACYTFQDNGAAWMEVQKRVEHDRDAMGSFSDSFGNSCALEGDLAVVGAFFGLGGSADAGAAYLFDWDELGQGALPRKPFAGQTLTLSTCGGLPGTQRLLLLVDFNGSPTLVNLGLAAFGSDGVAGLAGTVPSGLVGMTADFLGLGFWASGQLAASNVVQVTFR